MAAAAAVDDGDSSLLAVVAATALPCDEAVAGGGVDCDVGEADLRHCYSSSSVSASYRVLHCRLYCHALPAAVDVEDDALAVAGHPDHIVGPDHTAVVAAHHQAQPHGSWSCCPPATSSAAVAVDTDAAAAPPSLV